MYVDSAICQHQVQVMYLLSLQERTHKGKSSVFDRVVNQLSAAAATTATGGASTTSAQAAAALMRFGGIATDRSQEKLEETIREEDGLLSIDTAEKMLKWHAEAMGRCVELTPVNDVCVRQHLGSRDGLIMFCSPKQTFALLRVLAEAIGNGYVEAAIETCVILLAIERRPLHQ
jgi:hypothetical protein